MAPQSGRVDDVIRIRGARQNNLKGFDLDLPTRQLIVVTGLSGSGKSSLAFDTLYAEGQRRYIETFSPYARQFFDRMDKPQADAIEGIPPAIALEQRNSVRTTRSTIGTMTEVCDHLKVLWPHLARLHCRGCGQPVAKEAPREVWEQAQKAAADASTTEALITFNLPLSPKLSLVEQLTLVSRQGFQRVLKDGEVLRVEDAPARFGDLKVEFLTVVQDRIRIGASHRARFVEACEQAYHFGHGKLSVRFADAAGEWTRVLPFSRHLHCAACDLEYKEPTSALFSFNHPIGACPACKGFGRAIAIDYDRAIPDPTKTLAGGAVRPWQTGTSAECQVDLARAAKAEGIPMGVPFCELPATAQRWVIDGDPDYGKGNEWPKAWYGVKGYFRWLESKAYKMHVRVLLSRYRAYRTCPTCEGRRFQPDSLLWRLALGPQKQGCAGSPERRHSTGNTEKGNPSGGGSGPSGSPAQALTLADFYALPVREALSTIEDIASARTGRAANDPVRLALDEILARLRFLDEVGLGYLTLERPTRTLSGGETQRVNLTTCLGSRLVNTLFVLDEPSVGLHARDTERLVRILTRLRDLGNTVVVVEHEAAVMRAADRIVDLGPGHGEEGGKVVVHGTFDEVVAHEGSLTGDYLAGRRRIELPARRPVRLGPSEGANRTLQFSDQLVPYRTGPGAVHAAKEPTACLRLEGVTRHNLRHLAVDIPLDRLVCLTGVSGSGKTTLAGELLRLLGEALGSGTQSRLEVRQDENEKDNPSDGEGGEDSEIVNRTEAKLEGARQLGGFLLVDQSPIGRTPRSNPAVYTGAFDHVREVFAQSDAAKQRGLGPSAFSFNSVQGQCEKCRGAGFEKIEMQFLSDIFIRCPVCDGRRYRPHLLDIRVPLPRPDARGRWAGGVSIADALEMTIDDALEFLATFEIPAARKAAARLQVVQEVGLGYLRLGQPINTLSGGESQRLKLAGHLAESAAVVSRQPGEKARANPGRDDPPESRFLFVFDEPTTGLHFEDVRILLLSFQRLVDAGHSVLIIEHNLDVLKCADWLIDLGPEAGDDGGRVVVAGTPEEVAACEESRTGQALKDVLQPRDARPRATRPSRRAVSGRTPSPESGSP